VVKRKENSRASAFDGVKMGKQNKRSSKVANKSVESKDQKESPKKERVHIMGFLWPAKTGQYHKPIRSGGLSKCVHCGNPKIREARGQGEGSAKRPRTRRDGCRQSPTGEHVFATESVTRGWKQA
jgi:hypothetical protein